MKFILSLAFGFTTLQINAQSTEDSVKAVITGMFEGIRRADSAMVVNSFHPSAILHTIGREKLGQEPPSGFGTAVKRMKAGQLDERIEFGAVHVDANMASVWTPYRLYMDGKFIHCGVNSFQLVRYSGVWKIVHLIDTRRKDCD
jgi:hypothetical protein